MKNIKTFFLSTTIISVLVMAIPVTGESPDPNILLPKKVINMRLTENEMKLVTSVAEDCLDLLPDELSNKIIDSNIDSILQGAMDYNNPDEPIKYRLDPKNLGWQAALIIRKIYNKQPPSDPNIPALIYYEKYNDPNILQRLEAFHQELSKQPKKDKEYYSAAINILLDVWMEDLRKSGYEVNSPDEGVYLRNDENELYLYERVEK
ncbi:MAG: hypothetical protein ABSH16_09715 [Sedimentisphaerales bacterium]